MFTVVKTSYEFLVTAATAVFCVLSVTACRAGAQAHLESSNATDSTYSSAALRALVNAVVRDNHSVPPKLSRFSMRAESEISVLLRTPAARAGASSSIGDAGTMPERIVQTDQIESDVFWQRDGMVQQHIVGFRTRSIGSSITTLSYFQRPWVVPVLYGNRLHLLFGNDSTKPIEESGETSAGRPALDNNVVSAVHPFADDRDTFYRFSGGDTVSSLQMDGRTIPIVRIFVTARPTQTSRLLIFEGEIDVDALRNQIVRMHGRFVVKRATKSTLRKVIGLGLQVVAFADFINGEFDGQFWLPTQQRIEAQVRSRFAGDLSPIIRVVTRLGNHSLTLDSSMNAPDTSIVRRSSGQLTFASRDSLNSFTAWKTEIGVGTADARGEDFDDVAPQSWRSTGRPRIDFRAEHIADVARFNRVEGAFLGVAAVARFRDAAPGLNIGAHAGWATREHTLRGALWARWARPLTTFDARIARDLASTNDLTPLIGSDQSAGAFLATVDDADYVDRRSAQVSASRLLSLPGTPNIRVEVGMGSDRSESTRLHHGLVHFDSLFRENRAVTSGDYIRSVVAIAVHPNVSGDFLEPGIGASAWYERGDGQLRWQRLEMRATGRHVRGPLSYAGRVDAIAVFTKQVLPQQIIEFGETEGLPGYAYKEFGGDRAAVARAGAMYQLPVLQAPIRLGRWSGSFARLSLPGVAPGISASIQSGWSAATTDATNRALRLFGTRTDTLTHIQLLATRPTGGVRSTVSISVRIFGGALGLTVARPLDHLGIKQSWRLKLGGGATF